MASYQSYQNSAAIYDSNGTLIYYGYGNAGPGTTVHDFRVCSYNGTDHLSFFTGTQYNGYSRGQSFILDTNLRTVRTVTSQNALAGLDQHEFNIIGDSALATIYYPERFDLSAFNITSGQGWIQDGVFQDTNLTTGDLTFEWRAIEHVALSESYVLPNQSEVAGTGFSPASPWDYFHINSVDKNQDGDYLISARHTSTLYKINGQDGSIIWRCGGKLSDFELLNGLNWSYQHNARWISYNSSSDIISLFDNASNGFNQSAEHSAGYIIHIDHTATPPSVQLLKSWQAPADLPISSSQGNLQVLNSSDWANSNVWIGWGSQPTVTEYDPDGNLIYRAYNLADGKMNYRSYKFNVTITPFDSPALFMYSEAPNYPTTFHMSWNGATEVRRWRVYGRAACDDGWTLLDEIDKVDFETNYTAQAYQEFGMVEAVGVDGTGLRNSSNRGVEVFVPSGSLGCTDQGCNIANAYVVPTGQVAVAETRSGCPALALSTSSTSTSSSASGSSTNGASVKSPGVWQMFIVSSFLVGLML